MKAENEILREAVINLTLENAGLKKELKSAKDNSDMYREWWRRDGDKVDELRAKVEELEKQLDKSLVMPEGCVTVVEEQEK